MTAADLDRRARYLRFNVVGTSGSGKTTFGRALAGALSLPFVELDQVFWLPHWRHLDDETLRRRVVAITGGQRWVLDGNYSRTTALKWANAECVVWLDFSFPVTVWRALSRAVRRAAGRQELWPGTGNRESFRMSFFSRESVILWTLQHYGKNRRKYARMMQDNRYRHIDFVRLRTPEDAERFLAGLRRRHNAPDAAGDALSN